VPKEIIERADEFIAMTLKGKDLTAACSVMPQSEALELEEAVSCPERPRIDLMLLQEQIARDFLEAEVFNNPKKALRDILSISGTTESRGRSQE
jgi:DNA mismatch repair protein MSH5